MNWYAPTFLTVGANTTDINAIQLDDGTPAGEMPTVGWGDNMQIVGPLGSASEIYYYYDKSMNPAGEEAGNFWGDVDLNPLNVSFEQGYGIAIDNSGALTFDIVAAGQVCSTKVTVPAQANLNWLGNPFPAPININAIQLNDGTPAGEMPTVGWGDNMQIVGPLGSASEIYYYYDKSMNPAGEEAGNFWGDVDLNPLNITLEPGAGFAIDNSNGLSFNIEIACPY